MNDLTPAQVAHLDQSVASVAEKLNSLIEAYAYAAGRSDLDPSLQLIWLADAIEEITSHSSCAEILACAIARLYRIALG